MHEEQSKEDLADGLNGGERKLVETFGKYRTVIENLDSPNLLANSEALTAVALGLPNHYRVEALEILSKIASERIDSGGLSMSIHIQNTVRGHMAAIALASNSTEVRQAAIINLAKGFYVTDISSWGGHRMITQSIGTIAAATNTIEVLQSAVHVLGDYATRAVGLSGDYGESPVPYEQFYASKVVAKLTPQYQAPAE